MPHTWVSKLAKDKEKGIYNQVRWYIFSNHEVGLILEQCSEGERGLFVYAFKYAENSFNIYWLYWTKTVYMNKWGVKRVLLWDMWCPLSTRASLAFATV